MAAAGAQLPADWLAHLMMVFAARDRSSARALVEHSLHNYFHTLSDIVRPETLGGTPAEFEKIRTRMREMKYETVDELMGIFGDPAYCIDRIAELKDRFGFTRMVCWFEIGGLSGHRNLLDTMRLFAERVIPHFA